MKASVALFTFLLFTGCLYAQGRYEVRGVLQDTMGTGIGGATVKLTSSSDTIIVRTSDEGEFILAGITSLNFLLTVSNLGYQTLEKDYTLDGSKYLVVLDTLQLLPQSYELDPISILARRAIIIKKDTIEYRARSYLIRENAFTIDLLKKLPGININREGNLIAQGKIVTRVKVNGRDFFGGDVETAIRNIPANLIEKIQVIDDYGDKARLTGGTDGGYQKIINIKTWANLRKGYFGNASAGEGTEGRYQLSGMVNYLNNNRETAFYGNMNNNNARMPGAEYEINSVNNGLSTVTAAGFNYREKYDKNFSSYGNYGFSKTINRLFSETFRTNIYPDNRLILNTDTTNSKNTGYGHHLQWTLEYEDSLNFVQVTPFFSMNKKDGRSKSMLRQNKQVYSFITDSLNQESIEDAYSSSPGIGARVVANHKFGKTGRNVFAELSLKSGSNTAQENVNAFVLYYDNAGNLNRDSVQRQFLRDENENFSTSGRISYIEPVTRNSRVEVAYAFGYSEYTNDRETLNFFMRKIDSLSNRYSYSFTTNTINLLFRHNGNKHAYTVGVSVQPNLLAGESVGKSIRINRRGLNIVPEVNYSYLLSAERSFNVNYSASSNPPSYLQLQPVTDISNPQYPVRGNPSLKSELWHNFEIGYNNFSAETGKTFFAGLNGTLIQDQVVSNTLLRIKQDNVISQETAFENLDGSFMLGGVYNLSLPFKERKYVLDLNGSVSYNHYVSLSNSEKLSARNLIASQAVRMQINPNEQIEFYPSVIYTYNRNRYSIDEYSKAQLSTWSLGASSKVYLLPTIVLGLEADKNFNKGFAGMGKTNPFILNTFIEKQFLKGKKAAFRFSAFDILDQNTSVMRTIQNNATLDNRSNRLGRYFMLLFKLNLNKFEA